MRELEQAKSVRSFNRWNALKVILPSAFVSASVFGVATQVAGEDTAINVVLGVSISLVVPPALIKILWDRAQKAKLRARNAELEQENRTLVAEKGELSGQVVELRRQLGQGLPSGGVTP